MKNLVVTNEEVTTLAVGGLTGSDEEFWDLDSATEGLRWGLFTGTIGATIKILGPKNKLVITGIFGMIGGAISHVNFTTIETIQISLILEYLKKVGGNIV